MKCQIIFPRDLRGERGDMCFHSGNRAPDVNSVVDEELRALGECVVFYAAVDDIYGYGSGEEVFDVWSCFGGFEGEVVFLVLFCAG